MCQTVRWRDLFESVTGLKMSLYDLVIECDPISVFSLVSRWISLIRLAVRRVMVRYLVHNDQAVQMFTIQGFSHRGPETIEPYHYRKTC